MSTSWCHFCLALAAVFLASCRAQTDEWELNDGIGGLMASFGDNLYQFPSSTTGQKLSRWEERSGINPEELGEYPEGDILFPPNALYPASRNGLRSARRWSHGIVPYTLKGSFSYADQRMLEQAFADYAKHTCVRFIPRSTEADYLYITNDNTGCWSSVGKTGGPQQVNLQTPGCVTKKGTVVHELMHALGFLHEQNRWERDDYVFINYQNILKGMENNFEKAKPRTTDGLGIEYDYGSVMHYSEYAFSSNGMPTIKSKASGVTLGQREGLSKNDIKKIRRMYKCSKGKSYV